MNVDALRRMRTKRLLSWQKQYQRQAVHKLDVAGRHAQGTSYHTRAMREWNGYRARLQMIKQVLAERGELE